MQPYYSHNGIALYLGDCLEVIPELPDQSIDAVICDPPYGMTACAWDTVIPFAPMWKELKRLTKARSPIVLFGSQPFTSALVMSNPKWFKYSWVWDKRQTTGVGTVEYMPLRQHEDILVFCRSTATYFPQLTPEATVKAYGRHVESRSETVRNGFDMAQSRRNVGYPKSILSFPRPNNITGDGGLHPTQKPLNLMRYIIQTYTHPGDTVLDFACGSGTTLRAAKDLGRRAIGIEIREDYCEIAARRLSQEVMDLI